MTKEHVNDALLFSFLLFVSFGFWALHKLKEDYEVKVVVPLGLTGVPKDVRITTPLPSFILATLTGKGTSLIKYKNDMMDSLLLDYSQYENNLQTGRVQISMSEVRMALEKKVVSGTHIVDIMADTLEFYFNRGIHKRLPVQVLGGVQTHAHNYVRSMRIKPDSVDVYAPQSVLDTMSYAYTQAFTLTDIKQSTSYAIGFPHAKGVMYEPSEIQVSAEVDFYTEKTVRVPIQEVNFPAGLSMRTFPSEAYITFRIGASKYNSITASDFLILVSYEELITNNQPKYKLHLKNTPAGISHVRIRPSEVDYLIETSSQKSE